MDFALSEHQEQIRQAVRRLCAAFPDAYWRELDARGGYPEEFVQALASNGWLAVMVPEEYGGAGLGVTEACLVLEEIHRAGGNAASCHAQLYMTAILVRHASEEQRRRFLPDLAKGTLRLQAFAVTEPDAGSDTLSIKTRAERHGDRYVIRGQKVFISRVQQSDLMLVLARTASHDGTGDRTRGLSLFLVDLRQAGPSVKVQPIRVMMNHHTNIVFFDDVEVPESNLVGQEGEGFRHILDVWNAERILVASEAIGDGYWFVNRAAKYASERVVFGRPIGSNQGVQFPIAQAYAQVEAASLMRFHAAWLFDRGQPCGPQANMAKLLASQASWAAANACIAAHGGYGFAAEYDVERKFRETKLLEIAPVSNNLVLAYLGHRVLGMPRSY